MSSKPRRHVTCLDQYEIGPHRDWNIVKNRKGPFCESITPFFPLLEIWIFGFIDEMLKEPSIEIVAGVVKYREDDQYRYSIFQQVINRPLPDMLELFFCLELINLREENHCD